MRTGRPRGLVYGFGVNDADYFPQGTNPDGTRWTCPFYARWVNMIRRCYSAASLRHNPSYAGSHVCPTWASFMCFREWMAEKPWRGYDLDKDFLGANKLYSSRTCVFIPNWLNTLFNFYTRGRGNLPMGVYVSDKSFGAKLCTRHGNQYLGRFETARQAGLEYVRKKTEYVRSLYPEIQKIDQRLIPACERKLIHLAQDI